MVDEPLPPPAAAGPPDRRRPAPTIDLEATEIASDPVAGESSGAAGESVPGASPSEPAPEQNTDARQPPDPPPSSPAGSIRWPVIGGVLGGAAAALAGAAVALWASGGNDAGALEARVAQLEHQVEATSAQITTDPASAAAVSELAGRVGKLEAQVVQAARPVPAPQGGAPAADPALEQRVAALEGTLKTLGQRLDSVSQRTDSAAATDGAAINELAQKLARADASGAQSNEAAAAAADSTAATIADLSARVDALEAGAKALTAQAKQEEKQVAQAFDDHTLRTAVIASALAGLVERGRPFAAELKAAQAQAADPSTLAPLEGFAATGVPNPGMLTRELTELLPTLQRAAGHPDSGYLDKLEANAERLVRIRPIEETPGDDPAAIISRVEFKAVRGDLAGALAEFSSLPANVRAPAQGWIDKAQARIAALAASRAFAADALAALGKPSR